MVFIERLTVRMWIGAVLPQLLCGRLRGAAWQRCYVIDGSEQAVRFGRATGRLMGIVVERLQFRLLDIRDEAGIMWRFRLPAQDLLEVRSAIMQELLFRQAAALDRDAIRLSAYLGRTATSSVLFDRPTLWRALQVVQLCAWKHRQTGGSDAETLCVLERRPWLEAIQRYAAACGVAVVAVAPSTSVRMWMRRHLPSWLLSLFHALRARWGYGRIKARVWLAARSRPRPPSPERTPSSEEEGEEGFGAVPLPRGIQPASGSQRAPARAGKTPAPRIAVEYFGHLNLGHPERYSDLFFWQQSSLDARDLLVTFNLAQDPLDERKWAELARHGFSAVALQPTATTLPTAPVVLARPFRSRRLQISQRPTGGCRADWRWLSEQVGDYTLLREFWADFFGSERVKIFVSGFKYNATHCAIADALQSVGGVTAIYQRAYEATPSIETTVAADIVFGFSREAAEIEQRSGSTVPYYIVTGYLGDHRFPLLREQAARIRRALQRQGAQRILAFADENSHDDERWHTGHAFERDNYAFLLERLLADQQLGLVIKPKTPSTLRSRLGPVAELLRRAEATGRCVVFEEGTLQGSYPPAAAALASDLIVHGHLVAATAGLDAALAGVPTLLMDRQRWPRSPLYRLGVGRVVFHDWPSLWKSCLEYWSRPGGIEGFGDWSPMLEEMDPFRDGRAAERMGTYLQWLLDAFKASLDRSDAMAEAAERYAARWGSDKVTSVNCRLLAGLEQGRVVAERVEGVPA